MKQRLVGAVVLVSLAVIFIPMLLDGGDEGGMPMFGSNIPEQPDYHFEPLDIPLEPVEPIAAEKPLLLEKPEPAPAAETESEPEPESRMQAAASAPEPAVPPAQEKPAQEKKEASPPVAPDTSEEGVAWVVQVGSFSQSDNALALRDKLRGAGFTAFVEKLTVDGARVYRVRIGPELRREAAESQLNRLQREMKMEGIVMGHTS